jgi:hypothetical protein
MSFLSSLLYGNDDKKPLMESMSSNDIQRKDKKESENKNIGEKIIRYCDLFELPENQGKSLQIHDIVGSWIISEKGYYLKRIHSRDGLPKIESYWFIRGNLETKYYMTNGHSFTIAFGNGRFRISDGDHLCYLSKYEWI